MIACLFTRKRLNSRSLVLHVLGSLSSLKTLIIESEVGQPHSWIGLLIIVEKSDRLYIERTTASCFGPEHIITIIYASSNFNEIDVSRLNRQCCIFYRVLYTTLYDAPLVFRIVAMCCNRLRLHAYTIPSFHQPLSHPDNCSSTRSCNVQGRISQLPKSLALASKSSAESRCLLTPWLHYTSVRWHRRAHQLQDR